MINSIHCNKNNWILYKPLNKQTFEELSVDLIGVRSAWGRWNRSKMAVKTTLVILLLGIAGIFEVQAASIAAEKDMWKNLDEGLWCSLLLKADFIEIPRFLWGFCYLTLNLEYPEGLNIMHQIGLFQTVQNYFRVISEHWKITRHLVILLSVSDLSS